MVATIFQPLFTKISVKLSKIIEDISQTNKNLATIKKF